MKIAFRNVSFTSIRCSISPGIGVHSVSLFKASPINNVISRGIKSAQLRKNFRNANYKSTKTLKTKKAVLKRMRLTAGGTGMKCAHSGKSHLCANKGRSRISRLAERKTVKGRYLAKMKTLLMHGK